MQYRDETDIQKFQKVDMSSWDSLKDHVFVRFINQKFLSKYGDNVAHTKFLDLALTFSVQERSKDTILSYLLTEENLKNFNVKIDEVKQTALKNTTRDRKKRIMTFKESTLKNNTMYPVLQIPKGMMIGAGGHSMADCGIIQDTNEESDIDNILMLCNKHDVFGASYMASFDILEEIYERFQENFYIVPLSIHQVMCVRAGYASHDGKKSSIEIHDDFIDMIEDFNDSNNKSWKDILSYKIYYYFGDDGKQLFLIK